MLISGVSAITPASAASTQSICFDGTQTLSFTTTAVGTSDFTAELWVKPSSHGAPDFYETFLDMGLSNGGAYLGYTGETKNTIMFYDAGVGSGATEVPLNVWTHVAVVRSNSVLKLYIGGAQVGNVAHTTEFHINQN
jgi:hypothetical protein